jgi:hypothetical protein
MDHWALYEAMQTVGESSGRGVFIGEATGKPELPYAVLNPDWEPEPDIGQPLRLEPGAFRASVQMNSYGRANEDALWLDAVLYTVLMRRDQTFPGVNVIWREADDSPVLTRDDKGLILCKHWYRFVFYRTEEP